jgi:hypothetical protein
LALWNQSDQFHLWDQLGQLIPSIPSILFHLLDLFHLLVLFHLWDQWNQ